MSLAIAYLRLACSVGDGKGRNCLEGCGRKTVNEGGRCVQCMDRLDQEAGLLVDLGTRMLRAGEGDTEYVIDRTWSTPPYPFRQDITREAS